MIKAVIFDFDGTLANTVPLVVEAMRQAAKTVGVTLSYDDVTNSFGPCEEGSVAVLVPAEHYQHTLNEYYRHYVELHHLSPAPFEGIIDLLRELKSRGVIVALVTGRGAESCRISLEHYGMDGMFDMIETGSPQGVIKTECIGRVLKHFGLEPQDAVYVGDSPSDVPSSHGAGVPIMGVAWAPTVDAQALEAMGPDKMFYSVQALAEYLRKN